MRSTGWHLKAREKTVSPDHGREACPAGPPSPVLAQPGTELPQPVRLTPMLRRLDRRPVEKHEGPTPDPEGTCQNQAGRGHCSSQTSRLYPENLAPNRDGAGGGQQALGSLQSPSQLPGQPGRGSRWSRPVSAHSPPMHRGLAVGPQGRHLLGHGRLGLCGQVALGLAQGEAVPWGAAPLPQPVLPPAQE